MRTAYRVFVACCAACFGAGVLRAILRYGVHVPFWDQWDLVRMLRAVETGESSWIRPLVLTVSEHRIGVEWLASAAWWKLTGMNLRAEMVFNWCTALAFCLLAWYVTRKALPAGSTIPWTVLGAAALFLFNPAAFQVWLWGLPLVHALVPLLFLLGVAAAQSPLPESAKAPAMAVCALLASFTLASGLLLWMLFVPVLAFHTAPGFFRRQRIWLAVAAAPLAFTLALYALDRGTSPAGAAGLRAVLGFFVIYTGNLVARATDPLPLLWAQAAGAGLILFFVAALSLALLHLRGRPQWRAAVIWACMGCYSMAAGMMVAAGRAGFGPAYAIESSRYVLASSFLPLACVALGALLTARLAEVLPQRIHTYSWTVCATAMLLLAGLGLRFMQTNRSLATMEGYSHWMKQGKVALAAVNAFGMPEYRKIYSTDDPDEFKRLANYLNAKGWLQPPLWDESFLRRLAAPSLTADAAAGSLEELRRDGTTLYASGRSPAGEAVIVLEATRVLAVVFPSGQRWSAKIELPKPAPGSRIRCFAYHAETGQARLMAGERAIPEL